MLNLILCIVCTGGIFLAFRYFKVMGINTPMAIIINYAVAGTIGWTLAGGASAIEYAYAQPWFYYNVALGVGFLTLFNLIAKCTRDMGVAIASIATKLSLVIPVIVFITIFTTEEPSTEKIIAVLLAIVAIFLTTGGAYEKSKTKWAFLLPLIIFIGSGLIDVDFGYFSENLTSDSHRMAFTSIPFTIAFITGMLLRVFPKHRHEVSFKDLIGGVALGLVNFGSLFFLLGAYANSGMDKSSLIPTVNIGVVLFSTLGAIALFKEKPSTKTWGGLALGSLSIAILIFYS